MPQITTRIPEELLETLERAAQTLQRKRADVVRLVVRVAHRQGVYKRR